MEDHIIPAPIPSLQIIHGSNFARLTQQQKDDSDSDSFEASQSFGEQD
jgi:hypothetical protein